MRPDEHKKKQRAQYKKKHGISGKKTTSKEKKETNEGKESTESQGNADLGETDGVMNCVLNCKIMSVIFNNLIIIVISSRINIHFHVCWGYQRKFSRRNISSNWDRYEDLEQGELIKS